MSASTKSLQLPHFPSSARLAIRSNFHTGVNLLPRKVILKSISCSCDRQLTGESRNDAVAGAMMSAMGLQRQSALVAAVALSWTTIKWSCLTVMFEHKIYQTTGESLDFQHLICQLLNEFLKDLVLDAYYLLIHNGIWRFPLSEMIKGPSKNFLFHKGKSATPTFQVSTVSILLDFSSLFILPL